MDEYIKRESLIEHIHQFAPEFHNELVYLLISKEPAADVRPEKHGYWIREYLGYGDHRYRCSVCSHIFGEEMIDDFKHNQYCSDCGAKMDEKGGGNR